MITVKRQDRVYRGLFLFVLLVAILCGMAIKLHSLALRILYEKFELNNEHADSQHEEWYRVRSHLLSKFAMDRFIHAHQDEETSDFLRICFEKSDWFFTQLYHSISRSILTWFMTSTSCNGLLNRGSMFVFSSSQFRELMGVTDDWKAEKLLDLGAGDGRVTMRMAPMFTKVYTTEISPVMRWRLRQANFTVLDIEGWDKSLVPMGEVSQEASEPSMTEPPKYDVVACLNLLDRCAEPITLLRRMRAVLKPDSGRIVIALVLPLSQYVETTKDNRPLEVLDVSRSRAWEVQFDSFITNVLRPAGLELERWSRLPYLCEGDFARSFYSLNDVVMVVKALDPSAPSTATSQASPSPSS